MMRHEDRLEKALLQIAAGLYLFHASLLRRFCAAPDDLLVS